MPVFAAVSAAVARVDYPLASERYRFCTEALVRGATLPSADAAREALRARGDSLIVIRGDDVLKVHIHTDAPEAIFDWLRSVGRLVTHKAEDMAVQHAVVERAAGAHIELARRPVSILVDSACNLPDEVVRAHGMHVVPMLVVFDNEVLMDGADIDAARFAERLKGGERATTSQPAPASFLEGFRRAAADGESVLAILVGANLSGTFASAEAAARRAEGVSLRLFDSRAAGLTQGLLALRAAELAESGMPVEEIERELTRIRTQSGTLFTVDVFDNLLASGRVGRGKVMIAGLFDIKPILALTPDGRVGPLANVRGSSNVPGRMLDLLERQVPVGARALRFGIMHVGRPEIVEELSSALRRRWGERDIIDVPATPVIATHLGPGAWGIAWQLEDQATP